jgi:hypothetical protein
LNQLVEFYEIWYGGNSIQRDLDVIIFNPIDSIILELLRFKFVRVALLKGGFGLCSTVTMATRFFSAVNSSKLSYIELNCVKVGSLKFVSMILGSGTLNKLLV